MFGDYQFTRSLSVNLPFPTLPRRTFFAALRLCLLLTLSGWLTGFTAPLVLALLFVSPPLFLIHALLAGLIMAFCQVIEIRFAIPHLAGDLSVLWSPELQRDPLQFYTLGAITLLLYAFGCQLCLKLFPLQPLSWEKELATEADRNHHASSDLSLLAVGYLKALGGIGNLISMSSTLTYLTVEVESPVLVDDAKGMEAHIPKLLLRGGSCSIVSPAHSALPPRRVVSTSLLTQSTFQRIKQAADGHLPAL